MNFKIQVQDGRQEDRHNHIITTITTIMREEDITEVEVGVVEISDQMYMLFYCMLIIFIF
jgi:hypothetical protein